MISRGLLSESTLLILLIFPFYHFAAPGTDSLEIEKAVLRGILLVYVIAVYGIAYFAESLMLVAILLQKFTVDLWFSDDEGTPMFFILCALMTLILFTFGVLTSF